MMKKRTVAASILVCLIIALSSNTPASGAGAAGGYFAGGDGTAAAPYQINDAEGLYNLAELVNNGNAAYKDAYYLVTDDIYMSFEDIFTPIGSSRERGFGGTFDGAGHIIDRLHVDTLGKEGYVGLFGVVNGGTIKNLTVTGGVWGSMAGGIVGLNYKGTIMNCCYNGSVGATGMPAGIASVNDGGLIANSCQNSYFQFSSISPGYGIVGGNLNGGRVMNCYSAGFGSDGAVASQEGGVVENCYSIFIEGVNNDYRINATEFSGCATFVDETGVLTALDGSDADSIPDPIIGGATTLLEALNNWVDAHSGEGYLRWVQTPGSYPMFGDRQINVAAATGAYVPANGSGTFHELEERGGYVLPVEGVIPSANDIDRTLRFFPFDGYRIYDVLVDGESVGALDEYRLPGSKEDHDIQVLFVRKGTREHFTLSNEYNGYTDVAEDKWYGTTNEGVVCDATRLGLVAGDGRGRFHPEDGVRLGELVKIAATINNIYYGSTHVFDQTAGEHWWDTYVDYAVQNGMLFEQEFTDFSRPATRAEMAHILYDALPEMELPVTDIVDARPPDFETAGKYQMEVSVLYYSGILKGSDAQGTFHGERGVTRAETAAIAVRLIQPNYR